MHLELLDPAAVDEPTLAALVALHNDVRRHDAPHLPPPTVPGYRRMLRYGWDGVGPDRLWVAREGGRVVGSAELWLPRWDNRHLAILEAVTAPSQRGHGVGTTLLAALLAAAREAERTVAVADVWAGSAAEAFVASRGFETGSIDEQRRLELGTLDRRGVDEMYEAAAKAAADYELVPIVGAAPDSMLDSLVDLFATINDAPLDDLEIEDEVFTAERLRAFDEAQTAMGRRMYRLLARHARSGAWAGHTIVTVDDDLAEWGSQGDTSVVRTHRGHRLGILLKTAMLRWLHEEEPQLERIDTWNAASNRHMIAVNDALGYSLVGRMSVVQRRLDSQPAEVSRAAVSVVSD
jgi:RimJ/RimL family protein N-acetyltransferase